MNGYPFAQLQQLDEQAPRKNMISSCARNHPDGNQDRGLCSPVQGVAVVFDGLGGHADGARASTIACGVFAEALTMIPPATQAEARHQWLRATALTAHSALRAQQLADRAYANTDTTLSAAVLAEETLLVFNLGDSRVYRLRDGRLSCLTRDGDIIGHMFGPPRAAQLRQLLNDVQSIEQLDTLDARAAFSRRASLSQTLSFMVDDDKIETHDCQPGDVVIVCTDGVHDNLTSAEIEQTALAALDAGPQAIADALQAAARVRADDHEHLRAKDDDITVAVLAV